ncbi:hypothetical protein [Pyxidicoccus trucidator]|uniref:hypothetical protein n=1 Tax=Pyxidicoccus trucidator TaxID=2709662 RepID=UPI0013D9C6F4|nr:hypothetical protein [Pyxidicoccus trucidator]
MTGARGWTFLALVVGSLCLGCREQGPAPVGPSAGEREGRSEVLRNLMASKEQAPDPEALKGPTASVPEAVPPEPPGQGGSGRPEQTQSVQGRVSWVGDDELLLLDASGEERDLEVTPRTRLLKNGDSVSLRALYQGDEVRVSYEEGPGGWVAHQVEVLPEPELLPDLSTRPRQGRAPEGGSSAPLR